PEFVKYYHAEALHPFSYFAEKFGLEIDAASGASSHSEDKADALQVQSTTSASSPETAPDTSSGASY
ncbi:pyruvate oxidase, partial [Lactobacillus delbrueckii]